MGRQNRIRASQSGTTNGDRVTLHWVGDISLNGYFCSPQYQSPVRAQMAELRDEAGHCDLRVGNFEAPIWGNGRENLFKKTRVCTTEQAAKCILPLGLDLVFLGNNHVYDCCEEGFQNTTQFLRENGIQFLGAGTSQEEAAQPIIVERQGLALGFLNYVHRNTNPSVPPDAEIFLNYFHEDTALREIQALSAKVDAVLVYLHWGKDELIRLPSPARRRFGRRAVEAGAKVVSFDHAHCLQPHESYGYGHIIYGLGNFLFSDFPSDRWRSLACRTAMASIKISRLRVEGVRFRYLCRKDHIPDWDETKSRVRSHRRLHYCLRLPNRLYSLLYKCERIYQLQIVSCFLFVKKHGGIIPAIFQLRPRHLRKIGQWFARLFAGSTS